MFSKLSPATLTFLLGSMLFGQVTDGLVGHYQLDGNAIDASTFGNNGVLNGAISVEDRFGNSSAALDFDGTLTDYVTIDETPSLQLEEITFSVWVLLEAPGRYNIITKSHYDDATHEQFALSFLDSVFEFGIKRESSCLPGIGWQRVKSRVMTEYGSWVFVVGTWDGLTEKIYFNGQIDSTNTNVPSGPIDQCLGSQIRIGRHWASDELHLDGSLDDVRLYNRALSAVEIDTLYHLDGWDPNGQTMTDIDGNVYETVQIGDQTWMAENLKVTHYRNGDAIPKVTDSTAWANLTSSGFCNYDNNDANADIYGSLYNGYAVNDNRNIAPPGWHIPSDDEWKELEMAQGMSQTDADAENWRGTNEGSKLAGNADLWTTGSLENDAEFGNSGFNALPSGYRHYDPGNSSGYFSLGDYAYFRNATEVENNFTGYRLLHYGLSSIQRGFLNPNYGFSVRCVKNDPDFVETPQNLIATPIGSVIVLDWDDTGESDLAKYRIYRGLETTVYTLIDSVTSGSPITSAFTDNNVVNGTTYYYVVRAVNDTGSASDYSNEVNVTIPIVYSGPTWHVSTAGSDVTGNGSNEFPFASIQFGINAAQNGDTVLVNPGNYFENLNITEKSIALGSLSLVTGDSSFTWQTTIQGGGSTSGSVISIVGSSLEPNSSLVHGFNIVNGGSSWFDGGVSCQADATIERNLIHSNNRNGITVIGEYNPTIRFNAIHNNSSHGIHLDTSVDSSTHIYLNRIFENAFDGIYCQTNASPTIRDNVVVENGRHGFNIITQSNPTIRNNIIWGNVVSSFAFSDPPNTPILSYNCIEGGFPASGIDSGNNIYGNPLFCNLEWGNFSVDDDSPLIGFGPEGTNIGAAQIGCGLFYLGPVWHVSTEGSDSTGNGSIELPLYSIQYALNISQDGDSIRVHPGTYYENINYSGKLVSIIGDDRETTIIDGAGGPVVSNVFKISGFTITHGSPGVSGGGVEVKNCILEHNNLGVEGTGSLDIIDSILRFNSGGSGAAIKWQDTGIGILNVIGCEITSNEGGSYPALYKFNNYNTLVNIINCTIANNHATQQEVLHGNDITISNSIIHSNILDNYPQFLMQGEINVSYSDLQIDWAGPGNINTDPEFVDLENNDYRLLPTSPCIDLGNPNSPPDPDGTRIDMGSYYYDQSSETIIDSSGLFLLKQYTGIYEAFIYNNLTNQWLTSFTEPSMGLSADIISSVFDSKTNRILIMTEYSNYVEFHSYSPTDNIWTILASPPITGGITDLYLTYDNVNDRTLLIRQYYDFIDLYAYDAVGDSWDTSLEQPEFTGGVSDIAWVYHHFTNRSYLIREYTNSTWMYSFDYTNNSWQDEDVDLPISATLANLSAASNIHDNHIYISGKNYEGEWLIAYDPTSYTWDTNIPSSPMSGGINSLSLSYDSMNKKILLSREYANFIDIYAYDTQNSTWEGNLTGPTFSGGVSNFITSFYTNADTDIPEYNESILYVSVEGSDNQGNGSEHLPLRTIQHAINRASVGDTILVEPGQYFENINLSNKEITLSSRYIYDAEPSQIANTIIDGSDNDYVVRVYNSEITIIGITVTNGYAADGGGIYSISGEYLSIQNCIISNNIASSTGGAIYHNLGYLELVNTVVTNNISHETGGGLTAMGDSVYIFDSQFIGNNANNAGGAIYHQNSILDIHGSLFGSNSVVGQGGGLYAQGGELSISSSSFENNLSSSAHAGAIYLGVSASLDSLIFRSNSAHQWGGALQVENGNTIITHSLFFDNTAGDDGQAISLGETAGLDLQFCTIGENGLVPGAVVLYEDSNLQLSNSILWGNLGAEVVVLESLNPCIVNVNYCDIENGLAGIDDQSGDLALTWGDGNLNVDPQFESDTTYALLSSSQCIDAGDPDYDGDSETWETDSDDQDPDGTRFDIGYQYLDHDVNSSFEISGLIINDQTWNSDTIKVVGDVIIDTLVTLTIVPGTLVEFQGAFDITVNGTILAEGTNESPIVFDSNHIGLGWHGIRYWLSPLESDSSRFRYCVFRNGFAPDNAGHPDNSGGALLCQEFGKIYISHCLFEDNTVYGEGAAIKLHESGIIIEDSEFRNNRSYNSGGAIWSQSSDITLKRNTFFSNEASYAGGAIVLSNTTGTVIENNSLVNNNAQWGGAFLFSGSIDMELKNCVIWGNTSPNGQIRLDSDGADPGFSYCDIEDGTLSFSYNGTYTGTYENNIDLDPLFINQSSGILDLMVDSPCIDSGDPDLDGDGDSWVIDTDDQDPDGTRMDIGAHYYFQVQTYDGPTWYVANDGSDVTGNGSILLPFLSIQYAVSLAGSGDSVILAPGEYLENVLFNHDTLTMLGDAGGAAIVNGNNTESCFIIDSSQVDIFNLSFTNGSVQTWPMNGSGVRYYESTGNVKACKFYENNSTIDGSGAGGIGISYSNVNIDSCEIYTNNAADNGGGVSYVWASGEVTNSTISNNNAYGPDPRGGGGVAIWHSNVSLEHNLIHANSAVRGGGIWIQSISSLDVLNCTVTENSASERSGGISQYDWSNSSLNVENSIIWNNTAPANPNYGIGEPNINYSIIQWPLGTGNINEDPLLTDDYSLSENSPAIDMGNPDLDNDGYSWEVDPDDRDPDGTRMDIGAYYYHQEIGYNGPNWFVSIDGSDEDGDGTIELPYQTIQWAVSACSIQDTVILLPGNHEIASEIEFPEFPITIRSSEGFSSTSIVGSTLLNNTSPIICQSTIQGITFEGFSYIAQQGIDYLPLFNYCNFSNNQYASGGLFHIFESDSIAQFDHCIFAENTVLNNNNQIDGLFTGTSFNVIFTNCSFGRNNRGVFRLDYGSVIFNNCIVKTSLGTINGTGKQANYSFIEYPAEFSPGNMYECLDSWTEGSPGFSAEEDGILRLVPQSICIDQGNPEQFDPDGTRSDMGAIYFDQDTSYVGSRWHVDPTGDDWHGSGDFVSPFVSILQADNFASPGDTVVLLDGSHSQVIRTRTPSIVFTSMFMFGGDSSHIANTIIDGEMIRNVVEISKSSIEINGITIQNGFCNGGALCAGGLYLNTETENARITNCRIIGNGTGEEVTLAGGGILSFSPSLEISNCLFENNYAYAAGGALGVSNPGVVNINNSEFVNNHANSFGGAIQSTGGEVNIFQCLFNGNYSGGNGQVIYAEDQSVVDINFSTLSYNGDLAGSIALADGSTLNLSNSILWGTPNFQIVVLDGGNPCEVDITYTDFSNGILGIDNQSSDLSLNWGAGNFSQLPQFVSADDLTLQSTSPCIDSGDPDAPLDPDGTRADMGALYFDHIYHSPHITLSQDSLGFRLNTADGLEQSQTLTISNSGVEQLEVEIYSSPNVADIDGNVYPTIQIGEQVWMTENLKVTHYRDGTEVPNLTAVGDWTGTSSGSYCFYNNNTSNESDTYGALYNWYAVTDSRNIAPVGWHVPTDEEWRVLSDNLGGADVAGGKLKEIGTAHWNNPNSGATNESGFTALPAGYRYGNLGSYHDLGGVTFFWSTTESSIDGAWTRELSYNLFNIYPNPTPMRFGLSVRCVKDLTFSWLSIMPDTLIIPPNTSADVTFSVNAEGLELGDYLDMILITSNDLLNNVIELPVSLIVTDQDLTPPEVTLNYPNITEEVNNRDTLLITWEASDNVSLDWAKLWFSSDNGQSYKLSDSIDANWGQLDWIVPDVISDSCKLAIWVSDFAGNVSGDTLAAVFDIEDDTLPLISIQTPNLTTSVREHDSLHVSWMASDNIGIEQFELWYSNNPSDPFENLVQISGDDTTFAFAIGDGVSDSARIKMDVIDVAGNLAEDFSEYFSITDNTSPVISYFSIPDTIEWGIGTVMDIGVIASDNVEVTGLTLYYSTDDGAPWLPIVEDLYPVQGRPTYSWLIPDAPGECQLQVVVTDAVGLTATAYSDAFSIVIEYPRLIANLPEIKPNGDIYISFSQLMDSLDISAGAQVIGSVNGSYEIEGELSGYDATISTPDGFSSLDTLTLILSSSAWTNRFGYALDGNGDGAYDGNNIDNDTSHTFVSAAGDFDQNGILDFDDFDDFVIAWYSGNAEYELAPHLGEIPFISIQPDSLFNIFDLATFAAMWNWAAGISLSAPLTESFSYEEFISEQQGNDLSVVLPKSEFLASQTIIKYDPNLVQIVVADKGLAKVSSSTLSFVDVNPDSGFILITSSNLSESIEDQLNLTLIPSTKQRYSIEIAFQGSDMDANVIQKRTLVELLPIPTSFSLSQNYPNPFNASTTIEYGLPKNSDLSISIYDIRGRFVKDIYTGEQQSGYHLTQWNGLNDSGQGVASGLYFIVLNTPEYRVAKKALILK